MKIKEVTKRININSIQFVDWKILSVTKLIIWKKVYHEVYKSIFQLEIQSLFKSQMKKDMCL